MGTFVLKRKTFASADERMERERQERIEREEKKRMRRNIIFGTLGAGLAAGAAAYGAKKGVFGGKAQMKSNELLGKYGKKINNQKIQDSAKKDWYAGDTKRYQSAISKQVDEAGNAKYNEEQIKNMVSDHTARIQKNDTFEKVMNRGNKTPTPSTATTTNTTTVPPATTTTTDTTATPAPAQQSTKRSGNKNQKPRGGNKNQKPAANSIMNFGADTSAHD